jgi:ATP-dependent 26S proteasome regulatory subunit
MLLTRRAILHALGNQKASDAAPSQALTFEDFLTAFQDVGPSLAISKEYTRPIPVVPMSAVGGYQATIKRLVQMIVDPLVNPQVFERLGIQPPSGVLLYGPSGALP